MSDFSKLMEKIGYQFHNINLLETAFMHSSYVNERKINKADSYERLEFLGDSILELISSEFLFRTYPEKQEGELTKIRASLVCEYCLSEVSKELGYPDYVLLGKGERKTGGALKDSIMCDLFESVLGAIYLDGGMEPAKEYVHRFLLTDIDKKRLFNDAKTKLQEYVQKNNLGSIEYCLIESTGPEHDKTFKVACQINGNPYSEGVGHNLKNAEQKAAYNTLLQLQKG